MGIETAAIIGIVKLVAIAVASTAASYIITKLTTPKPEPVRSGEQTDLEITTARYGSVIARGYGDGQSIPGHWIWRSRMPWKIVTNTPASKHNPGSETHRYTIDCGVVVCVNPGGTKVLGVQKVKFDDVVIYPIVPMGNISINGGPRSGESDSAGLPITDGSANRINIGLYGASGNQSIGSSQIFEIRLGQQEQANIPVDFYVRHEMPDYKGDSPSGQSEHSNSPTDNPDEDENKSYWINYGVGEGYAPSYTNRVTIWFMNLLLDSWSRRLPQVKVELVFADNTVGEVIIAEVQLAGLTSMDVDVSAIASLPVRGLGITDVMPPKEVIGMLGIAHNFTMPLIDGKLKAISLIPPSNPPTVDLAHSGAQDGGVEDTGETAPKLSTLINEGTELPQRVEVSFIDRDRNFNVNRVGWGRLTSTNKGMVSFQWPMVLTPDEATVIAKRSLYVTRAERIAFSGELLPKYIKYHPGDVVKIVTPEGPTHTVRITKQNFAVGNKVEFEAVRVIPSAYVQVATGPTPLADLPPPPAGNLAITEFWVGDMPAMLDAHYGMQGFYIAAAPYVSTRPSKSGDNWFGAELWVNMGGTDEAAPAYIPLTRLYGNAIIAQTQAKLSASWPSPFPQWIDIFTRRAGRFYSMSDAQWANGEQVSNMLMVGREVIQFRHAEFISGGGVAKDPSFTVPGRVGVFEQWRLTELRRGLRGTKAQDHEKDTPVVLYDPVTVPFIPWNHSTLTYFNLRAVTLGMSFSGARPIAFRYEPETNQFSWAVSWQHSELKPGGETIFGGYRNPTHDAVAIPSETITVTIT